MVKRVVSSLKKLKDNVDWKLLIFLVLFLNIKMPVKIIAIVFIYLCQFNFKFGFKFKNPRLPLFYLLIIPIAFIGLLINRGYQNPNYMLVFCTGIGFWLLSILAIHQIKLIVERTTAKKIHQTIIVFFVINAAVSFFNLALIIHQTGSINPYTFKGLHQTYYIMTGDYIDGISFDISSTNAILSAFGVIYFLTRRMPVMLFVCMITLLLTYSNLINLMLLFVLMLIFIFKSTKDQKSLIVVCLMLFLTFMIKVSPQNERYSIEIIQKTLQIKKKTEIKPLSAALPLLQRPDSLLNTEEKRQKIATLYLDSIAPIIEKLKPKHNFSLAKSIPVTGKGRIYVAKTDSTSAEFRPETDISPDQKILLNFIDKNKSRLPISSQTNYIATLPGKIEGMVQTISFLYKHPSRIIAGLGIGNFSSKIAFRATGLGLRGHYPEKSTYINPAFLSNHLDLYLNYFSKDVSLHSVSNNPFSVYDQMLAEYGLSGLLVLLIFYFGFFARQYKKLSYGIPLLLFAASIFFIDYWFEQLSVMVLFELMLFLNIKENSDSIAVDTSEYSVEITKDKILIINKEKILVENLI